MENGSCPLPEEFFVLKHRVRMESLRRIRRRRVKAALKIVGEVALLVGCAVYGLLWVSAFSG
jgi:hypothetical protein